MKLAEFLSDLTSLQVCDPAAALALVSARTDTTTVNGDSVRPTTSQDNGDSDLKRAKDLLDLHATVKLAHQDGTDKDMEAARQAVAHVLRTLPTQSHTHA